GGAGGGGRPLGQDVSSVLPPTQNRRAGRFSSVPGKRPVARLYVPGIRQRRPTGYRGSGAFQAGAQGGALVVPWCAGSSKTVTGSREADGGYASCSGADVPLHPPTAGDR